MVSLSRLGNNPKSKTNLNSRSSRAVTITLLAIATLLYWPLATHTGRASILGQNSEVGRGSLAIRTLQSIPSVRADQPVVAAYFYRAKWGFQDEFLDLFRRNHYPVLEAQVKSGRLLKVETFTPRFHGDGRADWTFLTVLTYKNWDAFGDNTEEAEVIKKLYPNQEKFKKEEQRRFEILDAHWDVPLIPTTMK